MLRRCIVIILNFCCLNNASIQLCKIKVACRAIWLLQIPPNLMMSVYTQISSETVLTCSTQARQELLTECQGTPHTRLALSKGLQGRGKLTPSEGSFQWSTTTARKFWSAPPQTRLSMRFYLEFRTKGSSEQNMVKLLELDLSSTYQRRASSITLLNIESTKRSILRNLIILMRLWGSLIEF